MEKKIAQNLIESTFNESFNEERFIRFSQELLNDIDFSHGRNWSTLIYEDFADKISKFKRVGLYTDPEGNELEVLIVEVKTFQMLERARTSLRNFVIKWLQSDNNKSKSRDYGLVAFYSKEDEGIDWRFSFIKVEQTSFMDGEKGKVKIKKEFTPAKRYSFLVGKHEKTHTAKNQLMPLLQNIANNPTVQELEGAFSIEKVTDEFFNQYKDLYIKLYEHFENDEKLIAELEKSGIDNNRFTKKLLGQIVFLYFLQKKGWLGVAQNERWGTGKKRFVQELNAQAQIEGVNFFGDKLQYLFYEALAKERDNVNSYYKPFRCRIPFLNGGLFEPDYDWRNANISIPGSLFRNEEKNKSGDVGTGVLDVFDRYNFTIKEDEPLDKEVAVDPEMLGKVFENMLDITERKSKGAFYTPREIVHYMCQESLIHYLDNALNTGISSYQELGSDQTNLFGGSTDKKGNLKIEMDHNDNAHVPKKDIETFIREGNFALENDQRVANKGESKTYQYQLPESIRRNASLIDQKLSDIRICDPAIGSGAFPVGLLHELVTAMLVLKPHLTYDYLTKKLKGFGFEHRESINDSRYIYRLKRHIIQESIYGVDIDASAIDIARLRLWLSLVVDEDDLDPIETLPNLDYKIVCGNSLIGMPDGALKSDTVEKELEALKEKFYDITEEKEKKSLRQRINSKIRELLDSAEEFAGYKIDFDFQLFFSEVWREKGGFDVVIGNPPYGVSIKGDYRKIVLRKFSKVPDFEIYYYFIELSKRLLRRNGTLTYIIPNTILFNVYANKYREELLRYWAVQEIIDCTTFKLFESAVVRNIILVFTKTPGSRYVGYRNTSEAKSFNELLTVSKEFLSLDEIQVFSQNWALAFKLSKSVVDVIKTLKKDRKQLIEINPEISQGLIAYDSYRGQSKETIESRAYHHTEYREGLKKWILGEDVTRYKVEWNGRHYIDYCNGIANPRDPKYFIGNRVLIREITNPRIYAAYTSEEFYNDPSVLIVKESVEGLDIYSLTAILNSDIITFLHFNNSPKATKGDFPKILITDLKELPILKPPIQDRAIIKTYIIYIIFLSSVSKNDTLQTFFDQVINSIIYELYFPNEIKSAGKEILKHLKEAKPINDDMSEEEKLAIIKSEFDRLYDSSHPVRFAMETLDAVEEVRIIKEALK